MAQAIDSYTTSRFHNLSHEALADALGDADLAFKAHEAEMKALKDEFKTAVFSRPPASTSPSRAPTRLAAGSTPAP